MPLSTKTHECPRECLYSIAKVHVSARLAQPAAKQMLDYYIGYICRRQPIGECELKIYAQNLPLLKTKLKRSRPSQQLALISKGILVYPEKFFSEDARRNISATLRGGKQQHVVAIQRAVKAEFNKIMVGCTPEAQETFPTTSLRDCHHMRSYSMREKVVEENEEQQSFTFEPE